MQEADKIQYKEVATWLRWNVKVKTAPFKGRLKEIGLFLTLFKQIDLHSEL